MSSGSSTILDVYDIAFLYCAHSNPSSAGISTNTNKNHKSFPAAAAATLVWWWWIDSWISCCIGKLHPSDIKQYILYPTVESDDTLPGG